MQKRSLLSEYQKRMAAEMAAAKTSERALAIAATGSSGTDEPICADFLVRMPCVSVSNTSPYLFF
jgi:hypothetical protein